LLAVRVLASILNQAKGSSVENSTSHVPVYWWWQCGRHCVYQGVWSTL